MWFNLIWMASEGALPAFLTWVWNSFQNGSEGLPTPPLLGQAPQTPHPNLASCTPSPPGAGLRPGLPDHYAVRAGRLLAAAGPGFPRAATAALDASPVGPRVGSAARARPRLPFHRGRGERLGPGEAGRAVGRGLPGLRRAPRPRGAAQQCKRATSRARLPQVSFFLFVIFTVYKFLHKYFWYLWKNKWNCIGMGVGDIYPKL